MTNLKLPMDTVLAVVSAVDGVGEAKVDEIRSAIKTHGWDAINSAIQNGNLNEKVPGIGPEVAARIKTAVAEFEWKPELDFRDEHLKSFLAKMSSPNPVAALRNQIRSELKCDEGALAAITIENYKAVEAQYEQVKSQILSVLKDAATAGFNEKVMAPLSPKEPDAPG